jgi:cell division transport system permease protein
MPARSFYFAKKAVASMRESPWVSVLTTVTIAAAVLVLAIYTLAVGNLSQLALVWGRAASVTVYLQDGLSEASWEAVRVEIAKRPLVAQATLVRPQEALARFRARGAEAAALVSGVDASVLPASIEIALVSSFVDLPVVAALAQDLTTVAGVADVDYGREEFDRLNGVLRLLRYGGIAGALLVALACAFIVSNTVRLTVYARRDEIGILGLVGATAWFIRIPFIIEGALWGAGGGGIAAVILWALDRWAAPLLTRAVADVLSGLEIHLFAPEVAIAAIAGGTILAAAASGLAVRRFLDVELR